MIEVINSSKFLKKKLKICQTKAEIAVKIGQNHGETCGDTQKSTEYLSISALNLEIYTLVSGPAAYV